MPTTRTLVTLGDVVDIISDKYKVNQDKIKVFECNNLAMTDSFGSLMEIDWDSFIFQFDR